MENEEILRFKLYDERLYQLITSATQSYLLARTLSVKDENDFNLSLKFIIYHENLYIKNTIIYLYKILYDKKNESFNIHKYIRSIEANINLFPQLNNGIINSWKESLSKHQDLINRITDLRSKYYAHIDKDHPTYINAAASNIEFDDFENLFSDLQDFYIESNILLYGNITGFQVAISVDYFNDILSKHLK